MWIKRKDKRQKTWQAERIQNQNQNHQIEMQETDLDSTDNGTLREKKSHVTGEIEWPCKPNPSLHIQLPAASPPQLGDCGNSPFKRLSVQGHPIADTAEIRQVERHRPEIRACGHRGPPEAQKAVSKVPLPHEKRGKPGDPEDGD
ncbi:hypothetical protein ACLOJK_001019 [Asimina triloba]